ncbi:GntP family permease [Candidatus Laterigemmans baculatus]|uniref:GntP family permease n=1 Tax=Candidatus Laterigemmans baculatus TaxID=2770505 RepID=UPI0013DC09C5|nr:GntP family permease [Candidatus Laterigemmans baculatus]
MGIAGIVLSLLLLIYLAYRDVSVLVLAPLCALLAVLLDGNLPLLASYTQIFMASVGQFVKDFFPLFLLGAMFGKLMEDSGAAAKIADAVVSVLGLDRSVLAIVLSCSILTYGGVSLFVVVFAVFPLARSLFRRADLPRRLIPAAIALGAFTYTMTSLPGTVQIQNQIPMPFFRTTAFAAPGLGMIGGLVMFVLGMLWLNVRVAQARERGEGFGPLLPSDKPASEDEESQDEALVTGSSVGDSQLPSLVTALLPIFAAIALNFVFARHVIPHWDTSYLADEQFGATELGRVLGAWATILSMLSAVLLTIVLHFRSAEKLKRSLAGGAASSLLPMFNTASEYGYGNTIKALAGFTLLKEIVTGIAPGNPLISEAIAVNSLAAMTGSASGGLSIALQTLGETYYQRGLAAGIDPELLHRVASMSCGGLDSLPHNGAVITLLLICGVTHRQGYLDVGVVSVICPLFGTLTVLALGTAFGSF